MIHLHKMKVINVSHMEYTSTKGDVTVVTRKCRKCPKTTQHYFSGHLAKENFND